MSTIPAERALKTAEAKQQLRLLGYQEDETIFLRFFYPKGHPKKAEDHGVKLSFPVSNIDFHRIAIEQKAGRGCYFVINGQGSSDKHIELCRALFYEHDDIGKDLQKDLWQGLELPEPTFQLDTGGKSIHSYWVLDKPVHKEQWKALQADLLKYSGADPSIKNPSRVMRLAGCYHTETNQRSELISQSGKRYSFELLRSVIPAPEKEGIAETNLVNTPTPRSSYSEDIELAREMLRCIPTRKPGSNTYDESFKVLAALVHKFGDTTGLRLAREWSPDEDWGENLDTKVRGLKSGSQKVNFGSLVHIAKQHGWQPSKASKFNSSEWEAPEVVQPNAAEQSSDAESPDYDDVLNVVDQLEESEPDESRLHWELSNYAYDQGLKARGFNADYLLKQARARRDREGVLELEDTHDIMQASPERQWVVGGLLPANSVAIIGAPGGIGKTVLLYDIAKAIATGADWSGLPTAHGKVLIVQVDEPKTDTSDKLHEACFDAVPSGAITWCRRWRFTQTRQLFQIIRKLQPTLVVIDSITAAHAGTDIDMISSRAGDCVYKLRDFAEDASWPVSFWLVHHVNKGAVVGLRDSSTFKDNASEIQLLTKPTEGDWPKDYYFLKIEKSRAGLQGEYLMKRNTLEYRWEFGGYVDSPTKMDDVLNFVKAKRGKRLSAKEVSEGAGCSYEAAQNSLEMLRRMCSVKSERIPYTDKETGALKAFKVYYATDDMKPKGGLPPPEQKAVVPRMQLQELPQQKSETVWV